MNHHPSPDHSVAATAARLVRRRFLPLACVALMLAAGSVASADDRPRERRAERSEQARKYQDQRGRQRQGRSHDRRAERSQAKPRHEARRPADRRSHRPRVDHGRRYDHYRHRPPVRRYAPPRYYYHPRHYRVYDGYRYRRHSPFAIPRLIEAHLAFRFQSFFFGTVWHPGHGHHHDIYRFPIYLDSGVLYRPYAYCEGNYYDDGYFTDDGPRFDIDVDVY